MRITRTAVAGLALIATTALIMPPAAFAVGSGSAAAGSVAVSSGLVPVYDPNHGTTAMVEPDAAAAIIAAYWTPARKAAAVLDTPAAHGPIGDSGNSGKHVPDGVMREIAKAALPDSGSGVGTNVVFTNTDGKVFFHDPSDGRDHACSGGAVNSGKKRLAWTAGHCVHGGSGKQWMTRQLAGVPAVGAERLDQQQ
jgi:hypothetical protein